MPLLAFVLAIAFAFAAEPKDSFEDSLVMGYIERNNVCEAALIDCNNLESVPCTYDGEIVKRDNFITFCDEVLYHKPN